MARFEMAQLTQWITAAAVQPSTRGELEIDEFPQTIFFVRRCDGRAVLAESDLIFEMWHSDLFWRGLSSNRETIQQCISMIEYAEYLSDKSNPRIDSGTRSRPNFLHVTFCQ